jgi:hypothetical protein
MGYRILRHGLPLARCDELERAGDLVASPFLARIAWRHDSAPVPARIYPPKDRSRDGTKEF